MRKLFNFTPVFFVFILLASCNNGLVPMITENPNDTKNNGEITTPADFRAIGGKRKITLEWTESENATSYEIYAARTQFDDFIKVGDSSTSSFVYKVSPGLTRYFKIVAQNDISRKSSEPSQIVKGYSLATPVISEIIPITSEETGNKTTVYWFMENVEDYQDLICYEVICYDENLQIAEQQISGAETTQTFYTFENLPQNKNLQFEVQAYFQSEQNEIETSGKMDARTAAMQTPKAVESFTATEGTSKDTIVLSFKLPETAYIKVGTANGENVYDQYPLYFVVYRRIVGEENVSKKWSAEDIIIEHLYFDGGKKGIDTAPDFNSYIQGSTITYKDENLSSGKKYEYRIQSYIDNYSKEITSDRISVATSTGWTCGYPSLRTDEFYYTYDDDVARNNKLLATLDFKASWQNFGSESKYKFIVETTKTNISDNNKTISYTLFNSLNEINSYKEIFPLATYDDSTNSYTKLKDHEGYYTFVFYVVPATDAEASENGVKKSITKMEVPGIILVTSEIEIPEIKEFSLEDGYKEKVNFKWKKQVDINYILDRYTVDENGNVVEENSPFEKVTTGWDDDGDFNKYSDTTVESGKRYVYTLYASKDSLKVPSDPIIAETLGTPNPIFEESNAKHASIKLKWKSVLKAEAYSVIISDGNTLSYDSCDISREPDGEGYYTCIITNPTGYNDATKSGKTWEATVTAKNTKDTAPSDVISVKTLGPASLSADVDFNASVAKSPTEITVTWNPIPGAKGYAIKRTRYDVKNTEAESTDVYVISANPTGIANDVKKDSSAVITSIATATMNDGKIVFTDKYKEKPKIDATKWDDNQDKLSWGFPYHYTVLPLENIEEDFDGETKLGSVTYTNIDDESITKTGSCYGYGHNVEATKSKYTNKIRITWDPPYGIATTEYPRIFERLSGSNDDNGWKLLTNSSIEEKTAFEIDINEVDFNGKFVRDRTLAYDYLIAYTKGSNTATNIPHKTYYDSYTQDNSKSYMDANEGENINKGYAFAINLTGKNDTNDPKGLTELYEWDLWDYNVRKKGPESDYTFYIFNNDFGPNWEKIADISQNGFITKISDATITSKGYNISITQNGATYDTATNATLHGDIKVKPVAQIKDKDKKSKKQTEIGYNGLLKVLRDYKHFVKIEAIYSGCVDGEGNTVPIGCSSKSNSYEYGYREITDAEFVRATLLNIACAIEGTALYNNTETASGVAGGSESIEVLKSGKGSGSFQWSKIHASNGQGDFRWYINEYIHQWDALPSGLKNSYSFLKLEDKNIDKTTRGLHNGERKAKLRILSKGSTNYGNLIEITVCPEDSKLTLPSYTGIVKFTCDDNKINAIVSRIDPATNKYVDSTVVSFSDDDERIKYWCPIRIGNTNTFFGKNSTYGWW